jgi:hypothetical protein
MNNNFIIRYSGITLKTKVYYKVDPYNQKFIIIRRKEDLIRFIKTFQKYKYNNNIYFVLLDDTNNLSIVNSSKNFTVKRGQTLFIGIDSSIPFIIPTLDTNKYYINHRLLQYKLQYISDIYPYSILIPEDGMCYYQSVIFSILIQILYTYDIDINTRIRWLSLLENKINIFNRIYSKIYLNFNDDKRNILMFLKKLIIGNKIIKYIDFLILFITIHESFIRFCKNMIIIFIKDNLNTVISNLTISEFINIELMPYKNININSFFNKIFELKEWVPSFVSDIGILPLLLCSNGTIMFQINKDNPTIYTAPNKHSTITYNFEFIIRKNIKSGDKSIFSEKDTIPFCNIMRINNNHYFCIFLSRYIPIIDLERILLERFTKYKNEIDKIKNKL